MHFWLHHTVHCAGSVSAERVDRGRWVGSPQCDMHMVAAKLGCERVMVGTGWVGHLVH